MRTRYGTCEHGALLTEPCDDCGIVVPPKRDETVSHDTLVKQEDSRVIHDLFSEFHYADDLGVIKSKIAEYVATVRREAFKEARRKVYMISGSTNVDPSVRKGFAAGINAAIEVIAALEASATEKEGMNER